MSLTRRGLLRSAASTSSLVVAAACAARSDARARDTRAPARPTVPTSRPAPSKTVGPLPPEVTHGPATRAEVALTFHGSGPAALARQLLTEAERGGARVTVLAVGRWLDEQPEMAHRILDGGHDLGNHTEHHGPMAQMDAATAYTEISQCAARLRALTGSAGRWFRPSQMRTSTPLVRAAARRAGYPTVLSYDVDSLDYTDPGPRAITSAVVRAIRPGAIVSLHLGHPGTVQALPEILDTLHERTLRPVTVTELVS